MSTIDELKNAISETGFTNSNEVTQEILDELDIKAMPEHEMEDMYKDMLDAGETIKIGTLEYDVSSTLKAVDPIAYDVGFADYLAENHEEIFIEGDPDKDVYYITRDDSDKIDDYEPEDSSE